LVTLNFLLLVATGMAIVGVTALDRAEASVEVSVRRYAAAVTAGDLEAALSEVAPEQRPVWREWLAAQLGNIYEVRGTAVRSAALLERIVWRAPGGPTEVTVVLDVNRGFPGEFYQPTDLVPVEQVDGRWYLARPLLAH
jgi:hypothetical protein